MAECIDWARHYCWFTETHKETQKQPQISDILNYEDYCLCFPLSKRLISGVGDKLVKLQPVLVLIVMVSYCSLAEDGTIWGKYEPALSETYSFLEFLSIILTRKGSSCKKDCFTDKAYKVYRKNTASLSSVTL